MHRAGGRKGLRDGLLVFFVGVVLLGGAAPGRRGECPALKDARRSARGRGGRRSWEAPAFQGKSPADWRAARWANRDASCGQWGGAAAVAMPGSFCVGGASVALNGFGQMMAIDAVVVCFDDPEEDAGLPPASCPRLDVQGAE